MIDYQKIVDAEIYYKHFGYKLISVPWIISEQISDITMPKDKKAFGGDFVFDSVKYSNQRLVGSAEQSFLQMRWDGDLPDGMYMATTPCFRDESDDTHFPYFMKVELIHIRNTPFSTQDVWMIATTAHGFMEQYRDDIDIIETETGLDIVTNDNLELGSYGHRYHPHIGYWLYGTGIALPRFSL